MRHESLTRSWQIGSVSKAVPRRGKCAVAARPRHLRRRKGRRAADMQGLSSPSRRRHKEGRACAPCPLHHDIVAAVKAAGVPVEYIVFDDEGHGFTKKKNQIEGYGAVLHFLDKHMTLKGASQSAP
jgi:Prolyl oligopeptidase family